MQLLATEEYGLRCLLRVAAAGDGGTLAIPRIAEAEGLSPEYAAKLLRQLRLGGLVESERGADGGYRLARPASSITVWEALAVLGGAFYSEDFCACHAGQRRQCVRATDCSLRAVWRAAQRSIETTLSGITLEDLRRDEGAMVTWLDVASAASPPA